MCSLSYYVYKQCMLWGMITSAVSIKGKVEFVLATVVQGSGIRKQWFKSTAMVLLINSLMIAVIFTVSLAHYEGQLALFGDLVCS